MAVKLRCSKCKEIIADFKKNKVNCTIYREVDIYINDEDSFNFNKTEIEFREYLMCCNCGHKIPINKIKNKSYFNKLIKLIRGGDK